MSKAVKPEAPQKVDYNDAVAESKKYFDGDDLAATVWVSKYALKDSFGNIYETSPRQMHERIAAEIERIERKYPNPMSREEVFGLLDHFRYVIPQGGPMTGIGNNFQVASLSNCFVIGHKHPADSYGGIFRMDEEQVQLMKRRGGVGHDLSHIRPTGSPVLNSALTSTGIVPFMERYSNSTREVAQDGRRGALMLTLSIKHPDAERFIDAKVDTGKVTGANVSIKIDDEFMRAAIEGKPDDLVINTHVCRGNYHSTYAFEGGYDPIAPYLFAHENVDAFYLEFDTPRAGGFEPLKYVAPGKKVVLGLVTTKAAELENEDVIVERIREAAKYVPLENLYLSPQCGFASCEIGNKLTEDEQWAKIALVKRIAERVWK